MKSLFSVFDSKSNLFSNPFSSINSPTAMRDFLRAANDPNSEIHHNPADFFLYSLGEFDEHTCEFIIIKPINLGSAASLKGVTHV
ncbi:MAG: nonstructural protein [Microviridae sp.]|nr:MAG: nonstructural protein [Microviridae sp.]